MSASLRFVASMADQAEASRLRHDVRDILAGRFAGSGEQVRDRRGGRTLLAHVHERPVASVDVHWGGDAPLPPRLVADLDLGAELADLDPRQVVVLDTLLVHPDWRGRRFEAQLLEHAVRFAVEERARFVFGETDSTGAGDFRALGFLPVGVPRMADSGPMVSMRLDLADHAHLEAVGSPLLELARSRPVAATPAAVPDAPEASWQRVVRILREHGDAGGLFAELTDDELARVVGLSKVGRLQPGHRVVADGGLGNDLFVVLQGAVDVQRDGRQLARLGTGHVVGEVAFLLDGRRSADVVAHTQDVVLLRIPGDALRKLIQGEPELGTRLALGLARALCLKLVQRNPAT